MSTSALKALVLAGGRGTRLRPLTHTMAKQLVPVANQPILHYPLMNLVKAGITDIALIICPETGDAIKASCEAWCPPNVKLTYIMQDEPAGLAHAVKVAQPFLGDSPFVMYLGDNLIQSALDELITLFNQQSPDALILLKPVDNPEAFGIATLNAQGNIQQLIEKPKQSTSNLALVGVYLFTSSIFQAIDTIQPSARGELEITDAIQKLVDMGKTVLPCQLEGWWLDTGKKDDLLEANRTVLDEYTQLNINGIVDEASQIRGRVDIGEKTQVINSIIQGPVRIGERCTIENAYIGPYTSIDNDSQIIEAEVENSVILSGCEIRQVPARIEQSLLGVSCVISRHTTMPKSYQFLLGDQSMVEIL